MISRAELMHHRIQAILRDTKLSGIEYLGLRNQEHWYRIGTQEVPVSNIEELEEI